MTTFLQLGSLSALTFERYIVRIQKCNLGGGYLLRMQCSVYITNLYNKYISQTGKQRI